MAGLLSGVVPSFLWAQDPQDVEVREDRHTWRLELEAHLVHGCPASRQMEQWLQKHHAFIDKPPDGTSRLHQAFIDKLPLGFEDHGILLEFCRGFCRAMDLPSSEEIDEFPKSCDPETLEMKEGADYQDFNAFSLIVIGSSVTGIVGNPKKDPSRWPPPPWTKSSDIDVALFHIRHFQLQEERATTNRKCRMDIRTMEVQDLPRDEEVHPAFPNIMSKEALIRRAPRLYEFTRWWEANHGRHVSIKLNMDAGLYPAFQHKGIVLRETRGFKKALFSDSSARYAALMSPF